ncbi:hypothetical protein D3C81_1815010 [compost metagenome]
MGKQLRDADNHLVSDDMAVGIVNIFKMIQVHHHHAERFTAVVRFGDRAFKKVGGRRVVV